MTPTPDPELVRRELLAFCELRGWHRGHVPFDFALIAGADREHTVDHLIYAVPAQGVAGPLREALLELVERAPALYNAASTAERVLERWHHTVDEHASTGPLPPELTNLRESTVLVLFALRKALTA